MFKLSMIIFICGMILLIIAGIARQSEPTISKIFTWMGIWICCIGFALWLLYLGLIINSY